MPYHIEPYFETWMIVRDDGTDVYCHENDAPEKILEELHRLEDLADSYEQSLEKIGYVCDWAGSSSEVARIVQQALGR
jgi:hypothetical protein